MKIGGGSARFHSTLFFSQKLERFLCISFCWQALLNCASVSIKNFGTTKVLKKNSKNIIVVAKIATYKHLCLKSQYTATFCQKTRNIHPFFVAEKITHTHFFVAKIKTFANFGREKSGIHKPRI